MPFRRAVLFFACTVFLCTQSFRVYLLLCKYLAYPHITIIYECALIYVIRLTLIILRFNTYAAIHLLCANTSTERLKVLCIWCCVIVLSSLALTFSHYICKYTRRKQRQNCIINAVIERIVSMAVVNAGRKLEKSPSALGYIIMSCIYETFVSSMDMASATGTATIPCSKGNKLEEHIRTTDHME